MVYPEEEEIEQKKKNNDQELDKNMLMYTWRELLNCK